MTSAGIVLLVSALICMFIGIPIAYALTFAGASALVVEGSIPLLAMPQRFFSAINSFPLMAIIFFVIAGELMIQGGISKRLISFIRLFFGKVRGNLMYINFVTCAFFGAISGSALATTAAVGGLLYPEMVKDDDYDKDFAAAAIGVAGTLGLMIPPAISLILYGTITGASAGKLFLATIVPGILLTFAYCVTSYIICRKNGYGLKGIRKTKLDFKSVAVTVLEGVPALFAPVIILGGIYGGIFTATESAVVASVYSIIVGVFVYRELTPSKIFKALVNSAITSAVIMFLIGSANFFGWVMTMQGIAAFVSKALLEVCSNKIIFLLLMNVLFFICGMLMETSSIILLVVPLVYTVAESFGVNLVHFGVITCTNLAMGMFTPPFGANIFLAAGMTERKVGTVFVKAIPLILTGIAICMLVTFVPELSMWVDKI